VMQLRVHGINLQSRHCYRDQTVGKLDKYHFDASFDCGRVTLVHSVYERDLPI